MGTDTSSTATARGTPARPRALHGQHGHAAARALRLHVARKLRKVGVKLRRHWEVAKTYGNTPSSTPVTVHLVAGSNLQKLIRTCVGTFGSCPRHSAPFNCGTDTPDTDTPKLGCRLLRTPTRWHSCGPVRPPAGPPVVSASSIGTVDGINYAPTKITAHTRGVSRHTPRPHTLVLLRPHHQGRRCRISVSHPPKPGWRPYTLGNDKDRGCGV